MDAPATPLSASDLVGTWRLVRFTQQLAGSEETTDAYGPAPSGYLHYGADGRMMVLITRDPRPAPATLETLTDVDRALLFRTMIAYAGTYTFDGDAVTHHIEVSWNQVWTGTRQRRFVRLRNGRLALETPVQARSSDGQLAVSALEWEKAGSPACAGGVDYRASASSSAPSDFSTVLPVPDARTLPHPS